MDLASLSTLLISFGVGPLAAAAITQGVNLIVRWWLNRRPGPAPSPAPPAPPTVPVPGPAPSPPVPPVGGHPFRDWLMSILGKQASARYPGMTADEALDRHLVEQASMGYYHTDKTKPA